MTPPPEPQQDAPTTAALARSGALLGGGSLLTTTAFAYTAIPHALKVAPMDWQVSVPLAIVGVGMLVLAMFRFPAQCGQIEDEANTKPEPARSTELYGIYLVGVGFALLIQALMCSIVFAALSFSVGQRLSATQVVAQPGPPAAQATAGAEASVQELAKLFGNNPDQAFFIVGLFAFSSLVSMLGALFFFATALWARMGKPERDPFDRRIFWGGLWFRIGEAILFNLVFFLVLRYYAPDQFLILPLVSLLVGMFLKTGESLVSGIATRVFAAIQALVPTDSGSRKDMKLAVLTLTGFAPTESDPDRIKRVEDLAAAIKGLTGVEQVEADTVDPKALAIRAEYNATAVSIDDLRRKVQLKGLDAA